MTLDLYYLIQDSSNSDILSLVITLVDLSRFPKFQLGTEVGSCMQLSIFEDPRHSVDGTSPKFETLKQLKQIETISARRANLKQCDL